MFSTRKPKPNAKKTQIEIDNDLLWNLVNKGKANAAVSLYAAIKDNADDNTHKIMLNLHAQLGEVEKAEFFFNKIRQIESNSQCKLLNAYANAQEKTKDIIKKAIDLYQAIGIDDSGRHEYICQTRVTSMHYKNAIMVKLFGKLGDIKNAKICFNNLGNYVDMPHNKVIKERMLIAYTHSKVSLSYQDIRDAEKINSSLVEQNDTNRLRMLRIYANAKMETFAMIRKIKINAKYIFDARKDDKEDPLWSEIMHIIDDNAKRAAAEIVKKSQRLFHVRQINKPVVENINRTNKAKPRFGFPQRRT